MWALSVASPSVQPAACLFWMMKSREGDPREKESIAEVVSALTFMGEILFSFMLWQWPLYIGFQSLFTFFYKFIHFNWRILLYNTVVVLPYTAMNQARVYMCPLSWTPLPPPSPSHPSGSSQGTSPEHPVSRIEPGLAIHFTYANIHVSMSFSQIIPQSPKGCSICLCLFCCLTYTLLTFKGSLCEEHPT